MLMEHMGQQQQDRDIHTGGADALLQPRRNLVNVAFGSPRCDVLGGCIHINAIRTRNMGRRRGPLQARQGAGVLGHAYAFCHPNIEIRKGEHQPCQHRHKRICYRCLHTRKRRDILVSMDGNRLQTGGVAFDACRRLRRQPARMTDDVVVLRDLAYRPHAPIGVEVAHALRVRERCHRGWHVARIFRRSKPIRNIGVNAIKQRRLMKPYVHVTNNQLAELSQVKVIDRPEAVNHGSACVGYRMLRTKNQPLVSALSLA